MTITISSTGIVTANGSQLGNLVDVCRNQVYSALIAEVKAVFDTWLIEQNQTLTLCQADHAEEVASLIAVHTAKVDALEEDLSALGTKPEAQAIRKAQRRTELAKQLADLDKE